MAFVGYGSRMGFGRRSISKVIPQHDSDPLAAEPSTALWLAQLRWIAIAGQMIVISFVTMFLGIALPWTQLLTLVLLTVASNIVLWMVAKRWSNWSRLSHLSHNRILGGVLLFDVVILSGLLYFSGGAANPFILFYVANIAVAGVVLSRFWAVLIAAASVGGCFLLLHYAVGLKVFAGSPYGVKPSGRFGYRLRHVVGC
jgi:two-component system sensor histidine kinase RegB